MIRGTADLQYCTDLRNLTYAVESECMACLQASRRGELRELAGFVHVKGEIFWRAGEGASPALQKISPASPALQKISPFTGKKTSEFSQFSTPGLYALFPLYMVKIDS